MYMTKKRGTKTDRSKRHSLRISQSDSIAPLPLAAYDFSKKLLIQSNSLPLIPLLYNSIINFRRGLIKFLLKSVYNRSTDFLFLNNVETTSWHYKRFVTQDFDFLYLIFKTTDSYPEQFLKTFSETTSLPGG